MIRGKKCIIKKGYPTKDSPIFFQTVSPTDCAGRSQEKGICRRARVEGLAFLTGDVLRAYHANHNQTDDQAHAANDFYECIVFHGSILF